MSNDNMKNFSKSMYFTFTNRSCRKLIVVQCKNSNEAGEKFKDLVKERTVLPYLFNDKFLITATSSYLTGALL